MYMEEYAGYEEGYDDNNEEVSYDDSAIVHGAQNADGNKGNGNDAQIAHEIMTFSQIFLFLGFHWSVCLPWD